MRQIVVTVSTNSRHAFSKQPRSKILLLAGMGVKGDAHCGKTVQHRSRMGQQPAPENLRQVHLIQDELFHALAPLGFRIGPGDLGENITTRGLDLHALPTDTELHIGDHAVIRLTGLRNPCKQIEAFRPGLLAALSPATEDGCRRFRAGVMGVVVKGGVISAGLNIRIVLPPLPHHPLQRV